MSLQKQNTQKSLVYLKKVSDQDAEMVNLKVNIFKKIPDIFTPDRVQIKVQRSTKTAPGIDAEEPINQGPVSVIQIQHSNNTMN